jgi:hypothetical protein
VFEPRRLMTELAKQHELEPRTPSPGIAARLWMHGAQLEDWLSAYEIAEWLSEGVQPDWS